MVIHNSTFMIEPGAEEGAAAWIRNHKVALGQMKNARFSIMREAGGVSCDRSDAQSLALQSEFESEDDAMKWRKEKLAPFVERFMAEFGPEAMVFTSVFEVIPF